MAQTTIAIVCDCDDTLARDTTAQLLEACGLGVEEFYVTRVGKLVNEGYDPSIAYLNQLLACLPDLTRQRIEQIGASLELFPGVPEFFERLEEEIHEKYYEEGIRLKEFVISGGIKDLITASPLGRVVDQIWGCNFAYDEKGRIAHIKNVVSFTEKTRFLYSIQKGLTGPGYDTQPYAVNMRLAPELRPVPFKNMIYLGDGPSDIPCMSIVEASGEDWGHAIGILSDKNPYKTWALAHGRRARKTLPPDFTPEGKWAWNNIREAVVQLAERIKADLRRERETPYAKY